MNKITILILAFTAMTLLTGCHSKSKQNKIQLQEETAEDTIVSKSLTEDRYRLITDTLFHRSKEMIHDDYNGDYYLYSEKNVSLEWPEQLADCEDIHPLQQALIAQAFPDKFRRADIDSTVYRFIHTAKFLEYETDLNAIPLSGNESEGGMSNYYESVSIRLSMTSPSLVTYTILNTDYAGGAHGYYASKHVNFDKKSSTVYDRTNTFIISQKQKLLNIINRYVDQREGTYDHAKEIPDFYVTSQGITFVFPPYEVACYAAGIIEINIPYSELNELFTDEFKKVLTDAEQFSLVEKELE